MAKKYVASLFLIGVFKRSNKSEWGAPSFEQPKPKTSRVHFQSDLRNINKVFKSKPYSMTKINEVFLKWGVFKYATLLDLNIGYLTSQ